LLYSVVLVSAVQQSESAIYIYIYIYIPPEASLPPAPSHPSRSSQSTELSSLCYTASSHWLAILHGTIYIYMYICVLYIYCYSPNSSHPQLPPLCSHIGSLHLLLYSCPASRYFTVKSQHLISSLHQWS